MQERLRSLVLEAALAAQGGKSAAGRTGRQQNAGVSMSVEVLHDKVDGESERVWVDAYARVVCLCEQLGMAIHFSCDPPEGTLQEVQRHEDGTDAVA
jgi:hypothetical protein